MKREAQRPIIKFVAELFHRQKKRNRVAMIEHPVTSKMWAEPEMRSLNAEDVDFDACAYNDCIEDEPIKKPTRIKTTRPHTFPITGKEDVKILI